jgi:hypothetical protein
MSKVVVTYDTDTKELQMTIDGQSRGPLEEFNVYSDSQGEEKYGYFRASFRDIKENGVRYSLSAHGSKIEETNALEDFVRDSLNKTNK